MPFHSFTYLLSSPPSHSFLFSIRYTPMYFTGYMHAQPVNDFCLIFKLGFTRFVSLVKRYAQPTAKSTLPLSISPRVPFVSRANLNAKRNVYFYFSFTSLHLPILLTYLLFFSLFENAHRLKSLPTNHSPRDHLLYKRSCQFICTVNLRK